MLVILVVNLNFVSNRLGRFEVAGPKGCCGEPGLQELGKKCNRRAMWLDGLQRCTESGLKENTKGDGQRPEDKCSWSAFTEKADLAAVNCLSRPITPFMERDLRAV